MARPQELSRWPSSIGMVFIVFACLNLAGGVCGLMSPWFNQLAMQAAQNDASGAVYLEVTKKWQAWTIALAIASMALASVMLAVGVGLRSRRGWSIRLGRAWAVFQIAFAIGQSVVNNAVISDTVQAVVRDMAKSPRPVPPVVATGMQFSSKISLVLGVAWTMVLPVFLLVWLMRASIRAEVSTWTSSAADGGGRALPPV